ncbi:MAG: hypothetical protein WC803_01730 [Sphingomonas sp.]|jgi:hypothetical protein
MGMAHTPPAAPALSGYLKLLAGLAGRASDISRHRHDLVKAMVPQAG